MTTSSNALQTETAGFVPVIGRHADGTEVWYTGRAGSAFVSTNPRDAFRYSTVGEARRRAAVLNNGSLLHGYWFVACVGDRAAEVV